ncbi:MAG: MFS transporter [Acetivibrio sp.]
MKKIKEKKNSIIFTISIFILLSTFSIAFVGIMGYMNFKSNFKEIKEQLYGFLTSETIDEIENSLQYGKELENYYGAEKILNSMKEKLGEEFEVLIYSDKEELLYSTSKEYPNYSNQFRQDIYDGEQEKVGSLVTLYDSIVIQNELKELMNDTAMTAGIVMLLVAIVILIGVFFLHYGEKSVKAMQRFAIVVILLGIIIQSASSMYNYQKKYREAMYDGANIIVSNLSETVYSVQRLGVDLKKVGDLVNYLTDKIDKVPILYNIKLYQNVANTADETGNKSKFYISDKLPGTDIIIEADLSTNYINNKIMELVLIVASTIIIMLMVVFEIFRLPGLLAYRMGKVYNINHEDSYENVVSGIQLATFLCGMAEYMCVPYSAMVIRQLNQGAFGLSVGLTAALPITVEGLVQMVVIFTLPKVIRKIGSKKLLFLAGIVMVGINIAAFFSTSSLQIIICRAIAGAAYAGFAQIANYIVTTGYDSEERRAQILANKNAGVLAGITCGAGLGAIVASATSFKTTFLISSIIFAVYFVAFRFLMPWKLFKKNEEAKIEVREKTDFASILRMITSGELIKYIVFVAVPLNIGVVLVVTLIPSLIQQMQLNTIVLSYCYIVNGIAGIYLAPKIVALLTRKGGLKIGVAFSLILGSVSLFVLNLPIPIAVILISSALLGLLDGVGMPLSTNQFMGLSLVSTTISETTALVFLSAICYILNAAAPMVAESIAGAPIAGVSRYIIAGVIFVICAAVVLIGFHEKKKTSKIRV